MSILAYLEKRSRAIQFAVGFSLIGIIGFLDFLTGYELAFSLFYLIPVCLITWLTNRRGGFAASVASALIWLAADAAAGNPYSGILVPIWNTLIRLVFFLLISALLSSLQNALTRSQELSRTDSLTGAMNSRRFFELVQSEIERLQRYNHPFTLAYFDLDNFKEVNDTFGHPIGDQVLCKVVDFSKLHLRKSDAFARLGGDEFAILLPETDQEAARMALGKFQTGLIEEMRQCHWPVTLSIGVVTCHQTVPDAPGLLRLADHSMYSIKHNGKNGIQYILYSA
jgi:diguanylate cyclase (GGDEF)-like protein